MEDYSSSFFINGFKFHIESSINKIKEIKPITSSHSLYFQKGESLEYLEIINLWSHDLKIKSKKNFFKKNIFKDDFDEIILNTIFINNINLFREIITQNNLHFPTFWSHIGKIMKNLIEEIINKSEEEIIEEKKNKNEDNKTRIELGEINLLKLKIINISFYLITNVDSENFLKEVKQEKDALDKLFNSYIKLKQEKSENFSEFIINYIIKITLLINENSRMINLGFLKYLSFGFYDKMQLYTSNEEIKHLKIYIDQVINNPRLELNKYLNFGALNKKINNKKERIGRSRGASFDIRDPNTNCNTPNINIEKNNRKISEFFKKDKIVSSMNKSGSPKSSATKKEEDKKDEKEIKNQESKISSCSFLGKNLINPSGNDLNLMNFASGISNISNLSAANNGGNGSNKISLDDSLNLSGLFSKSISEIENTNKFKKLFFKCPVVPTIVKNKQFKKKKPTDKLRFKNKELVDIRKFINKKRKSENEEKEKEMKELREMINNSFYGNENENIDNIINIKEENNPKIKDIFIKKDELNKNQNKEILIMKTPNKIDLENQENMNDNINKNIDMNGIQRNLKTLFDQRIY